jgi:hypothetical protein
MYGPTEVAQNNGYLDYNSRNLLLEHYYPQ